MATNNDKMIELIKENFEIYVDNLKENLKEIKNEVKSTNDKIDEMNRNLSSVINDVANIKEKNKDKASKKWAVALSAIGSLFSLCVAIVLLIFKK